MTGQYATMFEVASHSSNKHFVLNPYKPGTCQSRDTVAFSLTNGTLPCHPDPTKMLVYNAEGGIVSIPVTHGDEAKHNGPVTSHMCP